MQPRRVKKEWQVFYIFPNKRTTLFLAQRGHLEVLAVDRRPSGQLMQTPDLILKTPINSFFRSRHHPRQIKRFIRVSFDMLSTWREIAEWNSMNLGLLHAYFLGAKWCHVLPQQTHLDTKHSVGSFMDACNQETIGQQKKNITHSKLPNNGGIKSTIW